MPDKKIQTPCVGRKHSGNTGPEKLVDLGSLVKNLASLQYDVGKSIHRGKGTGRKSPSMKSQ